MYCSIAGKMQCIAGINSPSSVVLLYYRDVGL